MGSWPSAVTVQEASLEGRFRLGDVGAFEELFRLHQRAVYGWVLRIVRDAGVAEDLTVETFWRVYRSRMQFDAGREFLPWVRRIATRVALDWLRTKKPEVELDWDVAAEVRGGSLGDPGVSAEIRAKTVKAFGRLPVKLRVAATLAVVEELTHKEIADALGISISAVKVRVFRALRLLRKDLEAQGMKP